MTDTSTPKVSVIVCTYNQEKYIARTLDSILSQQTAFPFEILLADDASADATPEICRRYAGRFPETIRFVGNRVNKGPVRNYFDTLRLARGEYIADLAGDDLWTDPLKLARQTEVMDSDPSITICHAAWRYLDESGSIRYPEGYFMPEEESVADGRSLIPDLLNHNHAGRFVHLCSSLYRRDTALSLAGSFPQLFSAAWLPCEDLQLIVMLASRGKVAWLPQTVMHYRVGQVSVSSPEDHAKSARFVLRSIRLTFLLAETLRVPPESIASYYRRDIQYALRRAQKSGDRQLVAEVRNSIRKMDPEVRPSLKTRLTMLLPCRK